MMDEWDEEGRGRRQDTHDPDYFEGDEWDGGDEDGEIEARLARYEEWLGRT